MSYFRFRISHDLHALQAIYSFYSIAPEKMIKIIENLYPKKYIFHCISFSCTIKYVSIKDVPSKSKSNYMRIMPHNI